VTAWRRLLHRWAGGRPTRVIEHDGRPLFERSVVWSGRVPLIGEIVVYLHHYLISDPNRGLHDHPWPWAVSLPLAGGYVEERLRGIGRALIIGRLPRRPLRPYRLGGHDFHRVVLHGGVTSWSLFITGATVKEWGFLRDEALPTDGFGVCTWMPQLAEQGSHTKWWLRAPRGRDLERAAP